MILLWREHKHITILHKMLRNELWEEIKTAKTNNICCLCYSDKKRKVNRWYQWIMTIIAGAGIPSFFYDERITLGTTIASTILGLINSIIPAMGQSDEDLEKIDDLATYFGNLTDTLCLLWNEIEKVEVDANISSKFQKALKFRSEKTTEMNRLIHRLNKREEQRFMDAADEYLIRRFYSNETETKN